MVEDLLSIAGISAVGGRTPSEIADRFLEQAALASGIDPARLTFAAEFGRRLDYYSGFVFEIHAVNPPVEGPLVGGGRYDKLVTLLGAENDVPAIGFSMWLDRIAASVRS